ncbi:ABC transporter permease [Streptomyces sp. NPDC000941]
MARVEETTPESTPGATDTATDTASGTATDTATDTAPRAVSGAAAAHGGRVAVTPRVWGGPVQSVRDSLVVARRNLIRMMRIPEVVVFGLVQPIMFVVLFSYVFGGAIMVPGQSSADANVYREFLMAGIFAQTVTFATAGAGAGIADDMHKGLIDRFRSLPMARGAVLTGRTLADLVQTALTLVVLAIVAVIVGWRIHAGVLKALAAFGLLLLLGYAFSWIGALIGLSVRTPEAATSGGLIWLFPLTFISNAFVPSSKMPAFLGHIADWNPFSATVQASRQLFGNPEGLVSDAWPMQHPVLASVLWSTLIILAFRTLAVRKYRSATA